MMLKDVESRGERPVDDISVFTSHLLPEERKGNTIRFSAPFKDKS
jgi:hypothetical protein